MQIEEVKSVFDSEVKMRLIDADKLVRDGWMLVKPGGNEEKIFSIISPADIPTAYDVDHVVSLIKKNSRKMSTASLPHIYYRAIGTKVCEVIIRGGGIDS